MANEEKNYTLVGVKEMSNFDRKVIRKDNQLIETETTTKVIIKTYNGEE